MIRIAAVGDIHVGADSAGVIAPKLAGLGDEADLLLLAGDLTKSGGPDEARVLAGELRGLSLPVVAVLGNHDHHQDRGGEVVEVLHSVGVEVLEGAGSVLDVDGGRLGVVGAKGFAGGFEGASGTAFGEREMKAFIEHTEERARAVDRALAAMRADLKVLLLHYAPVRETLQGEPVELFPFLGSYLFAEVADRHGVDLVVHGHAHAGVEKGSTPGGIPVRNVAQPVLRRAYALYAFDERRLHERRPDGALRSERVTSGLGR